VKVLLTKDVPNVGRAGETKDVADGYARNYLLPRGLASVATEGAVKQAAERKTVVQRREAKKKAEIGSLATTLSQTQVTFKAKVGEQHRLYGSITAADVAEEISRVVGQPIDKRDVELGEPIRHLGTFKVPVRLGRNAVPAVTVVVESE
jgi:large subunit ribosomal protein L9